LELPLPLLLPLLSQIPCSNAATTCQKIVNQMLNKLSLALNRPMAKLPCKYTLEFTEEY
jgi:hypothetical protein